MGNKKISELPAATEPLNDADLVEVVQGGINKKAPKSAFGGGAVDSVNGQTGVVVLDAGDVGAVASVTGTAVDNTDPENPVIDLPSPTVMTYSTETATHELDATDLASVNAGESLTIRMNAAGAIDLEIPTNAVQAFAVGTIIGLEQMGAGQLTIVPDVGVTLRSPNSANKTYAQYSKAYIEKVGTNEWLLSGDITV